MLPGVGLPVPGNPASIKRMCAALRVTLGRDKLADVRVIHRYCQYLGTRDALPPTLIAPADVSVDLAKLIGPLACPPPVMGQLWPNRGQVRAAARAAVKDDRL